MLLAAKENSPSSLSGAFASAAPASPLAKVWGGVWKEPRAIASRFRRGGKRLVLDHHGRGGGAARLGRMADDNRDDLPMVPHLLVREERLILARPDIVVPGDVLGHQHRDDSRHGAGGRRVPALHACVRMGEHTGHRSSMGRRWAVSSA